MSTVVAKMLEMLDVGLSAQWWSGVGALATVAAAIGVAFAVKQLRFDAWSRAQDIIANKEFEDDRTLIFRFLDEHPLPDDRWTEAEDAAGLRICKRMTELCRLAPYFALFPSQGRLMLIRAWDEQIAKSWMLLKPLVAVEYRKVGGSRKYDAFSALGSDALRELPREQRERIVAAEARVRLLPRFEQLKKLVNEAA